MARFTNKLLGLIASAFIALLAACSFGYSMYNTEASYIPEPGPGDASITFFWDATISASVSSFIAMSTGNGQLSYIGALGSDQRIVEVLNPGSYTFVMGGEGAQILKVDLENGKNYYVQVVPSWEGLVPRFNFKPLSPEQIVNNSALALNIQNSVAVVPNPNGLEWFQLNIKNLREKLENPSTVVTMKASDGLYNPL